MEGGSFDNNILCNEEKVIICMRSVLDKLLSEFPKNNTAVLNQDQVQKVLGLVVKNGEINKGYMGKNASRILGDAGINVNSATRLAVFVADSESNPMVQHEQLMPVLPIFLAKNALLIYSKLYKPLFSSSLYLSASHSVFPKSILLI